MGMRAGFDNISREREGPGLAIRNRQETSMSVFMPGSHPSRNHFE